MSDEKCNKIRDQSLFIAWEGGEWGGSEDFGLTTVNFCRSPL